MLVVDGGPTMNPSTYELLAGIHAAPGDEVLVLPNSPNVILAAERACGLSEKPAAVVPTTAPQEGLAALLAFDPARPAQANATAVSSAAEALRIGGVAPAARDDVQGRFMAGDAVGYAGGELVAWGDPAATLAATLDQLVDGAELLTCIAGEAPPLERTTCRRACPTASSWSTTRAASPPGGGCSARSDALALCIDRRADQSRRRCRRRALVSAPERAGRAGRRASTRSASRRWATSSSTSRTRTATA